MPNEPLTADEAKRIRIALIFGDPSVTGLPDPALEEAKRKLRQIEKNACTCDHERPETFDPACPKHGEGTLAYKRNQALQRGDFAEYDLLGLEEEL